MDTKKTRTSGKKVKSLSVRSFDAIRAKAVKGGTEARIKWQPIVLKPGR